MEPSEEIRRVIERWTLAIAEGDHDSALGRLSNEPGALIIRTNPAEWWRDAARDPPDRPGASQAALCSRSSGRRRSPELRARPEARIGRLKTGQQL